MILSSLFSASFRSEGDQTPLSEAPAAGPSQMQRLTLSPASSQGVGDKGRSSATTAIQGSFEWKKIPDYRSEGSCRSGVKK